MDLIAPSNLKTSLFYYITVPMILTVLVPIGLIVLTFDTVWANYQTNVPVNSVIFLCIFYATGAAFYSNLKLMRVTRYLKRVEAVEQQDEISADDVDQLMAGLRKDGHFLDIQNMRNVIKNIAHIGYASFTDNDSRLIKSKFGFRTRNSRQVVTYFAGVLVMLGLIGTFWGLLITIDAVAQAMGAVSQSFSSGEQDIGGFITAISRPLQGMGLAFSSSLFGLSGSLFLGFLNFFAASVQNNLIEDVARWIDGRIPSLNEKLKKKTEGMPVPKSDDLKAWLAGFIHLSMNMNRRVGALTKNLVRSNELSYVNAKHIKEALDHQVSLEEKLAQANDSLKLIAQKTNDLAGRIEQGQPKTQLVVNEMAELKQIMVSTARLSEDLASRQSESLSAFGRSVENLQQASDQMARASGVVLDQASGRGAPDEYGAQIEALSTLALSLQNQITEISDIVAGRTEDNIFDLMKQTQDAQVEGDDVPLTAPQKPKE